jgi:acyl-CoA thioesterase FadM
MNTEPPLRFLTASLKVDYLRPTPIEVPLEVRATVKEIKGRKVVILSTLSARGEVCARGEVIAVQVPEHLAKQHRQGSKRKFRDLQGHPNLEETRRYSSSS